MQGNNLFYTPGRPAGPPGATSPPMFGASPFPSPAFPGAAGPFSPPQMDPMAGGWPQAPNFAALAPRPAPLPPMNMTPNGPGGAFGLGAGLNPGMNPAVLQQMLRGMNSGGILGALNASGTMQQPTTPQLPTLPTTPGWG